MRKGKYVNIHAYIHTYTRTLFVKQFQETRHQVACGWKSVEINLEIRIRAEIKKSCTWFQKCRTLRYSYRLDFFTIQYRFILRCTFSPTAAAPALESWSYQSLPSFFSFVLHSFFPYCLRRWRFVVHALWLWCKTWVSAVLAGAFLLLFFARTVIQCVQSSWKQSVVIQWCDWVTHLLFNR